MTMVVAMWCRHTGDNIIGTNNHLPWQIESDSERFWEMVKAENVVCGRKTYQSMPVQKMEKLKKIFVFSHNDKFEITEAKRDKIISSQKQLEDCVDESEDIYIAGGAQIYRLFMEGKEKFKPHIIVDCVYEEQQINTDGNEIEITPCIEIMRKKYMKITPDYCLDNVAAAIWIRKGEFVEQSVLKRIICILEKNAQIR